MTKKTRTTDGGRLPCIGAWEVFSVTNKHRQGMAKRGKKITVAGKKYPVDNHEEAEFVTYPKETLSGEARFISTNAEHAKQLSNDLPCPPEIWAAIEKYMMSGKGEAPTYTLSEKEKLRRARLVLQMVIRHERQEAGIEDDPVDPDLLELLEAVRTAMAEDEDEADFNLVGEVP